MVTSSLWACNDASTPGSPGDQCAPRHGMMFQPAHKSSSSRDHAQNRSCDRDRLEKKGRRRVTFCNQEDEVVYYATPTDFDRREDRVRENMALLKSNHESVMRVFGSLYDLFASLEVDEGACLLSPQVLDAETQAKINMERLAARHRRVVGLLRELLPCK
ncbi:unnamed protein product [Prorocentrum cordatum]|uniref:Mediator of RNA polymerase II transcription subunit 7 n=1 Tax=Prorocentrum cordatum TaxID=2364126 RepID=A0ABN9XCS6_9DINO|nr:unnamed protein product [Polarella glacialis]